MKKLIYFLILTLLILSTTSCVPTKYETAKDKLESAGYHVQVYNEDKYDMSVFEKDFGYVGVTTVITAFINSGERIEHYVNIIYFDTIKHAKEGYERVTYLDDVSPIKDETVYGFYRSGKCVYYGDQAGIKALSK